MSENSLQHLTASSLADESESAGFIRRVIHPHVSIILAFLQIPDTTLSLLASSVMINMMQLVIY